MRDRLDITTASQGKVIASVAAVSSWLAGRALRGIKARFEEAWVGCRVREAATSAATAIGTAILE